MLLSYIIQNNHYTTLKFHRCFNKFLSEVKPQVFTSETCTQAFCTVPTTCEYSSRSFAALL